MPNKLKPKCHYCKTIIDMPYKEGLIAVCNKCFKKITKDFKKLKPRVK